MAVVLHGCVAAAVPVAAAGIMTRDRLANGQPPKARPVRATSPTPTTPADYPFAPLAPVVPAPSGDSGPYAEFTRFALKVAQGQAGGPYPSAVVDQRSLGSPSPAMLACTSQPPAVVIDLDSGSSAFDLADPPLPANGLAAQLEQVRAGGVTVLWSASLPTAAAEDLYTILQATGLDPHRTDRLLLLGGKHTHKQGRRIAAARDWCIVAIAGDRRSDFDEVFDYLRNPQGPFAQALETHVGAGWFIAPPPID